MEHKYNLLIHEDLRISHRVLTEYTVQNSDSNLLPMPLPNSNIIDFHQLDSSLLL